MNAFWNISHIDLSEGIPSLNVAPRVHGVFGVFWWRGIPLGHEKIKAAQLPMSSARLAGVALRSIAPAVNAYFAEQGLETPLRATERMLASEIDVPALFDKILTRLDDLACHFPSSKEAVNATISVIIPTLNRPTRLAACLRSLEALRQKPREIVVVDNASQCRATRHVVENFPRVRYLAESRPGSSTTRNTGIRHSSGDIIAFADDDETVHPDWLTWIRQCFHDPAVAVVTGLVLPAELATEAQFIFESRFSFIRGYSHRTFDSDFYERTRTRGVPVWQIGGSGNMAIRRDVFDLVGGFDERLGAGRAGGCEELELFYRVLAHGWHCRYEPRAVAYHHHRRNMNDLKQQLFCYMRGHVAASLLQYAKHKDRGNLRHLFCNLPLRYARHCLRSLMLDPACHAGILRAEISGCLSGARFYWHNRTSHQALAQPRVSVSPAAPNANSPSLQP